MRDILVLFVVFVGSFSAGVYAENWAARRNAQGRQERRLRRLVADLRREPSYDLESCDCPLCEERRAVDALCSLLGPRMVP